MLAVVEIAEATRSGKIYHHVFLVGAVFTLFQVARCDRGANLEEKLSTCGSVRSDQWQVVVLCNDYCSSAGYCLACLVTLFDKISPWLFKTVFVGYLSVSLPHKCQICAGVRRSCASS